MTLPWSSVGAGSSAVELAAAPSPLLACGRLRRRPSPSPSSRRRRRRRARATSCSASTTSGLLPWYSPPRLRNRMNPGSSSVGLLARRSAWAWRASDVGAERLEADAADRRHRVAQARVDDLGRRARAPRRSARRGSRRRSRCPSSRRSSARRPRARPGAWPAPPTSGARPAGRRRPSLATVCEREPRAHRVGAEPEQARDARARRGRRRCRRRSTPAGACARR